MGNTHDSEIARIEADHIENRWKTAEDYMWGYTGDRGPETWWVHYPSASGSMQSPVDIITEETWQANRENSNFEPLEIDYSSMCGGSSRGASRYANLCSNAEEASQSDGGSEIVGEVKILVNNGNTSRINFVNSRSYVTGGPYRHYNFLLEQIHMHWGESDKNGSEHYVNGKGYSAELHFVHWNEDLYSSYEEAARNDDGILVLAVFVQVSDTKTNDALKQWSDMLEDTMYREENVPMDKNFPFHLMIPKDTSKFWTYQGSLTTPPCYESVTWVVFENCIYTSSAVLKKYRELKYYAENETRPDDEFDGQLKTNNRPVQPIGVRKICHVDSALFRSIHEGDRGGSGGGGGEPGRPFRGGGGDEKVDGHLRSIQTHLRKLGSALRHRG